MSVDYPNAIDMTITDPTWVFTDALISIPLLTLRLSYIKLHVGKTALLLT